MGFGRRAVFETQRSLAHDAFDVTYTKVGSSFSAPVRMLMVQNLTDATLQFSVSGGDTAADALNDHFVLQTGTQVIFDFSANRVQDYAFMFAKGDAVFVKDVGTPTTGNVYVSVVCGVGD